MAHDTEAAPRLEPPGVPVGPVLWAAMASIALVLAAIGGLSAVYHWRVVSRAPVAPEPFPPPRVQTHQDEQRQELLAAQRRQLSGYAWADDGRTLVRVPIERAMDLIAQRGVAAYAPLLSPGNTSAGGAEPATSRQMQPRAPPPPATSGMAVPDVGTAHRRHGRLRSRRGR